MNGHGELTPFAERDIIVEKISAFDLQEQLENVSLAIEKSGYEPPKDEFDSRFDIFYDIGLLRRVDEVIELAEAIDRVEIKEHIDKLDKAGIFFELFPIDDRKLDI